MKQGRPSFIDSEYFVMELNNWHLLEGAPQDIVDEFNQFMANLKISETKEDEE